MHDSELRAIYARHGETIDPNQRGFSLHIQKAFPEVHRFSLCVFQVSWFKDNWPFPKSYNAKAMDDILSKCIAAC